MKRILKVLIGIIILLFLSFILCGVISNHTEITYFNSIQRAIILHEYREFQEQQMKHDYDRRLNPYDYDGMYDSQ